MEQYLEKLKEYLKMDTEISFEEFDAFYKSIMDYLKENYDGLDQQALIKAKYILSIVEANAVDRAKRKGTQAKKYKKIGEKGGFWVKAIDHRLLKEGMTQEQIDEAEQKLNEAI